MTDYTLSEDAERDVIDIYLYSIEKFGLAQADRYLADMFDQLSHIGGNIDAGKACDEIKPGLFRLRCVSHVIYYRAMDGGAFILRILHGRMDPGRHL